MEIGDGKAGPVFRSADAGGKAHEPGFFCNLAAGQ
jgi:hypothetical protein